MQSLKELRENIDSVSTMGMVVQAMQEISVMKMQKERKGVIQTRSFLTQLSAVFYDVKMSYKNKILRILSKKNKGMDEFSSFVKNGKSVSVLLSSNGKLQGDIISKVFKFFMEGIKDKNDDIIIVGKVGKELYENSSGRKQATFFEIPDSDVKIEDLKQLVLALVNYQKIDVYYGKFESIVTQTAIVSNVSGYKTEDKVQNLLYKDVKEIEKKPIPKNGKNPDEYRHFLFEPSLDEILQFFETQVFASLFKQTVSEAQLARHGSRIRSMGEAVSHIETEKKSLSTKERRTKQMITNKKQIEKLSGVMLWS
jgi:ATP synthase F1 gamma subunit